MAGAVTLEWNPSSSTPVGGYRMHWGNSPRNYPNSTLVGIATRHTLSGLQDGKTYYIAVTAVTADGSEESGFSNEVVVAIPSADRDGDGKSDNTDNCPSVSNTNQRDTDRDGQGDACDADDDDDGIADSEDDFPLDPTRPSKTVDSDNDGLPDVLELANGLDPDDPLDADEDRDGDGFSNRDEVLAGSNPDDVTSTPLVSGGGSFAQIDLMGRWHSYAFSDNLSASNGPAWSICSPRFDALGTIVGGSCIDARDISTPVHGKATLQVDQTYLPVGQWVEDIVTSHYRLDVGKTVIAGVATRKRGGRPLSTLSLTIKEGSGYRQSDLAGTWYRFRYSDRAGTISDPRWTYAKVSFDATGLIIDSEVFDSAAPTTSSLPWTGSASVEPGGEIVPAGDWVSTHSAFSFSMDAGKSVVAGVATRSGSAGTLNDHELWIKQGDTHTQADLKGTWYLYSLSDSRDGANVPVWTRRSLVVDSTGDIRGGSGVDGNGEPREHDGELALSAGGRVTSSGALAFGLDFQSLRLDAGRTVIGGVQSKVVDGEPLEGLVVAVKSGDAHPEILTPLPGTRLSGSSATFEWTDNGAEVSEWRLTIGTSRGASDLHDSGPLAGDTRVHGVNGLPTVGDNLHVRLHYRIGTSQGFDDVQYATAQGPVASADSSGVEDGTPSAPDLSFLGLLVLMLGSWTMVRLDERRRMARD